MRTKRLLFADLDGTFLDDQYDFQTTKPIVDELTSLGVSIVFCSSKTRHEIEYYRKVTSSNEPFISENGAAIFIPKDYFPFDFTAKKTSGYHVIRLSTSYKILRNKLAEIKENTTARIVGFGDMTLEELAYDTGLPIDLASLAKKREHDEPFRIVEGNKAHVISAIRNEGLSCVQGGRYFHLTGGTDKGKAVLILKNLYSRIFEKVETIAVGDGPNDFSMFRAVEKSFLIKKSSADSRIKAWSSILAHAGNGVNF